MFSNDVYLALSINVIIESWSGLPDCVVVILLTVYVALLVVVLLTLINYRWYDILQSSIVAVVVFLHV